MEFLNKNQMNRADETEEEEENYNIYRKGNEIYFYEDIYKEQILKLTQEL